MRTLLQLDELFFAYEPFSLECYPEPETRMPHRFVVLPSELSGTLEQPFHILIRCRLAGCHLTPATKVSLTHRPPTLSAHVVGARKNFISIFPASPNKYKVIATLSEKIEVNVDYFSELGTKSR